MKVSRLDKPTDSRNTVETCIETSDIDSSLFPSNKTKGLSTKINDAYWISVESASEQIGCSLKTMQSDKMPITKGFIGKVGISVLRDSGCNFVIVKNNLVEEKQLTGNHEHRLYALNPFMPDRISRLYYLDDWLLLSKQCRT